MSRLALEIKDMFKKGINNTEQYRIVNVEVVLKAADLLLQALNRDEISIKELMSLRIALLVNSIRKNNRGYDAVKCRLRCLVLKMQGLANNIDTSEPRRPNGCNGHREIENERQLNQRTPNRQENKDQKKSNGKDEARTTNGHVEMSPRIHNEGIDNHPRLQTGAYEAKKPKARKPTKPRLSPQVPPLLSAPVEVSKRSPPQMKSTPPLSNVKKPSIKLVHEVTNDSSVPPVEVVAKTGVDHLFLENDNVPNETLSDVSTNQSSNSLSTLPEEEKLYNRKRKHPTAAASESQAESDNTRLNSDALFSNRVRFIPSVTVSSDFPVNLPSTPNHTEVRRAAEGEEWEGITGVRDTQGNFHRWHQEITLEPDGTEPFLHILPYVDIDLELL